MNGNTARGTPGIMLSVIATGLVVAAFTAWETRLHRGSGDEVFLISGLGDRMVYLPRDEDFHEASITLQGRSHGLFRRGVSAVAMPDEAMFRVASDPASGLVIYTDDASPGLGSMRCFLKVSDGAYMEFGDRNHWPGTESASKG